jgi:hypothetical protein
MMTTRPRLIFLCVDGSSSSGDIRNALKNACTRRGISISAANFKYSGSAGVRMSRYLKKVRDLVSKNGMDPTQLCLLVVGKSLGGAKMYRFFFQYADYLKFFHKIALILVDAHEPGAPGNEGDVDKWYDYVHFSSGHQLKWWTYKWGPAESQLDASAKIRVYVIYQRNDWPRGYGMREAYRCDNLTEKTVLSRTDSKHEPADHWNLAWCDKTVDLMADAVSFLNSSSQESVTESSCSDFYALPN